MTDCRLHAVTVAARVATTPVVQVPLHVLWGIEVGDKRGPSGDVPVGQRQAETAGECGCRRKANDKAVLLEQPDGDAFEIQQGFVELRVLMCEAEKDGGGGVGSRLRIGCVREVEDDRLLGECEGSQQRSDPVACVTNHVAAIPERDGISGQRFGLPGQRHGGITTNQPPNVLNEFPANHRKVVIQRRNSFRQVLGKEFMEEFHV